MDPQNVNSLETPEVPFESSRWVYPEYQPSKYGTYRQAYRSHKKLLITLLVILLVLLGWILWALLQANHHKTSQPSGSSGGGIVIQKEIVIPDKDQLLTINAALKVNNNVQIVGNLQVDGITTLQTLKVIGDANIGGNLQANNITGNFHGSYSGDGTGLTGVNAGQLSGQSGDYYTNASNLRSGTLSNSRLSTRVTLQGNQFNAPNELVQLDASGSLPAVDGSHLTNVNAATLNGQPASYYQNASNLDSGTLADNRLSSNVALLNQANNFSATNTFSSDLTIQGTVNGQSAIFSNSVSALMFTQNGNAVCDTSGNCAGSGGGITGAGTASTIALFTSTGSISNSIITQSGTTVTVAGTVSATAVQGDGSGLTNVNAATLNGQPASYYQNASNLTVGTLSDNRLSSNVPLKNASNTFTGTTNTFSGVAATTIAQNGNQVCDNSGNCGYAPGSGSGNYIQNGTTAQSANFNITGNGTLGGSLTVNGGEAVSGASTLTGATNINTTGTANTNIGNSSATFSLTSNALNITTAGAVSGITTLQASGAITGATSGNTINGLIISSGNLAGVTGITSSGGYSQTGSGANTFSGTLALTTLGAASNNTALCYNSSNQISGCSNGFETTNGSDFIRNQISQQASSNFNISGNGTVGGVLTVNGSELLQPATDSTTAFQINRSSANGSTPVLSVDTTNNEVVLQASNAVVPVLAIKDFNGTTTLEVRSGGYALNNTFVGLQSGQVNTGVNNVALGTLALKSNTSGSYNTAVGSVALNNNTTGFNDTAIGYSSLASNTTGSYNTAVGLETLLLNTTGLLNSAFGTYTLSASTTGNANSGFGHGALYSSTTGSNNSGFGYETLLNNTTGSNNSALGYQAGFTDGTFSTGATLQNATALGYESQVQASNSLTLGGQGSNAVNVGIGTTVPLNTFSVSPLQYNTGTASQTSGSDTITGSGTTWTANMVGDEMIYTDGSQEMITGFTDATHLTGSSTIITETGSAYRLHYLGLQVTSAGNTILGGTLTVAGATSFSGTLAAVTISQNGNQVCDVSNNCGFASSTNSFTQGGNNFGATATLGTKDSNSLNFITNNTTVASLSTSGQALFKNSTNSATAFQVQNAGGATILSTDTTTNTVTINGNLNLGIISTPTSAPTVAINASPGNLNSTYYYVVTYVTPAGETNYGPASAAVSPVNQQVNLNNIPISPNNAVTARRIYRTLAGVTNAGPFQLVTTINDNTSTTYTDNKADGSLGAGASQINRASGEITLGGINEGNFNLNGGLALGYQALQSDTTGTYDVAVGPNALLSNTTGGGNSAFSINALVQNTTGNNNSAFGNATLYNNTTGTNNTAFGAVALISNTVGSNNTAIGVGADVGAGNLQNATSIGASAVVGESNALVLGGTGTNAVSVGIGTATPGYTLDVQSSNAITASFSGRVIGGNAVNNNEFATLGQVTSAVSGGSGNGNYIQNGTSQQASSNFNISSNGTIGGVLTVNGSQLIQPAADSTTAFQIKRSSTNSSTPVLTVDTLNNKVVLQAASATGTVFTINNSDGTVALQVRAGGTGLNNSFIGVNAGAANTTGNYNSALGSGALAVNTVGYFNTAVGGVALTANTTGYSNTAIGLAALQSNTTGLQNTAVGETALQLNTSGSNNAAVGQGALAANTTGYQNTGLGGNALAHNTGGIYNSAFGFNALQLNTIGSFNVGFGVQALNANTTGNSNLGIGLNALDNNTTGSGNIGIGNGSADAITTGSNNTLIGFAAGTNDVNGVFATSAAIQNSTAIGDYAQVQASNSIVLGSVDNPANVGIGITVPLNRFAVSPLQYNTGTAAQPSGSATITGTGTTWTANMLGDEMIFADGSNETITGFTDATHLTGSKTTISETTTSAYRLHYSGLQVTSAGNVGIGTTAPGAQIQVNSSSSGTITAIIQGASGQAADLQQWQDSTGIVLASISAQGNLTVKNAVINGTLTVNGHIITGGSTPTIVAGAGAGTAPTVSVAGNDTSGTITITTDTAPAAGTLATIIFNTAYGTAPRVILTPMGNASASLQYNVGSVVTTNFTLNSANSPTATTTYTYFYHAEQ